MSIDTTRTSIAVAICTYKRNEPLETLLEALVRVAEASADKAEIGVVVVDDNPDASAESVVARFVGRFPLGAHYRHSGQQNISITRNLAMDTASGLAAWVAMTDDDCEPDPDWVLMMLATAAEASTQAVTGSLHRRPASQSPAWVTSQPFLEDGAFPFNDGEIVPVAATNNSMISSDWWREHPDLRFRPSLGVIGGEDMVFYRLAVSQGLRIAFSEKATMHENQPACRLTLGYHLRSRFWMGNTEYVTNVTVGTTNRTRLFLRGMRRLLAAIVRPATRIARGKGPQARYALAEAAPALGMLVGLAGVRVRHH